VDTAIKESNNHPTKTDQNLTYDNRRPQIGDLSLHGHAQLQEVDGPLPWWRREDTRLQLESWQCCPGGGCTERAGQTRRWVGASRGCRQSRICVCEEPERLSDDQNAGEGTGQLHSRSDLLPCSGTATFSFADSPPIARLRRATNFSNDFAHLYIITSISSADSPPP
jgi:hypothetical protein